MKVKELIEMLQGFNPNTDVCVFDYQSNLEDDFDGSRVGIYPELEVYEMGLADIDPDSLPFIAIAFTKPE